MRLLLCSSVGLYIALYPAGAAAQEWHELTSAIQSQDLPEIQKLLREGTDPDAGDEYGNTALHEVATWGGGPAIVETLLRAGADPVAVNNLGETPAQRALRRNKRGVAQTIQRWITRQEQQAAAQRERAAQTAEQRAADRALRERELAVREMEAHATLQSSALQEEIRELRAMIQRLAQQPTAQEQRPQPVVMPRAPHLAECTIEGQWKLSNPELSAQRVPFCLAACAYLADGAPDTSAAAEQSCDMLEALMGRPADEICGVCAGLENQ